MRPAMIALAAFAGLLVVGGGAGWLAGGYGLGDLDEPGRLWEKTLRLAMLGRLRPAPQQTPREFARRLQAEAPDVGPVDALAEAYARSRFGRKAVSEEERDALRETWKAVRSGMLRRLILRRRRT